MVIRITTGSCHTPHCTRETRLLALQWSVGRKPTAARALKCCGKFAVLEQLLPKSNQRNCLLIRPFP